MMLNNYHSHRMALKQIFRRTVSISSNGNAHLLLCNEHYGGGQAAARLAPLMQTAPISSYCQPILLPNLFIDNHQQSHSIVTKRQLTNASDSSSKFAPSKFLNAKSSNQIGSESTSDIDANCSNVTNVFNEQSSEHLPSLPVPPLGDTLERLKETIWPIAMNSAEFANALELIENFSKIAGPKLDLLLRVKAKQTKNWMTHDWWTNETYLKSRSPLLINSNPSMIYPQFPFHVNNQRQLINTMAQLISSLIEFKFALYHGYNPEATSESDEFRLDSNLCYSQYKHIFGTTRLPGEFVDELYKQEETLNEKNKNKTTTTTTANDEEKLDKNFYFALALHGQFYEICLGPEVNDSEQLRIDTLVNLLNKLFDHSQQRQQQVPNNATPLGVGLLTTCARDQWANARKLLRKEALESIEERAQFLVCLDSVVSSDEHSLNNDEHSISANANINEQDKFAKQLIDSPPGSEQHLEALSRQILHADRANVSNRWFDKSLQLIIVSDKSNERYLGAGINYEHSLAEGQVVTKMIEFSYDRTLSNYNQRQSSGSGISSSSGSATSSLASFKLLNFEQDDKLQQIDEQLRRAHRDYAALVDQFDLAYFNYKSYGSNAIKSWRFSPDSWFQVGLQLAHYKLHKRLGPCYESASTRRFAFGRTETIRSLTKDVAEFCQQPTFATMQAAIKSHKSYANAANNALAIDRVLMGYKLVFNELKSNSWPWGVPTFQEQSEQQEQQQQQLINTQQQDNHNAAVDLENLFTERELEILSSFFTNELIERSKKFALSTSQVQSSYPNICMCYGPILTDGYGCCYNITGQQIVAAITANSENLSFSCQVDKFSESLHEALDEMQTLVENERRK